MPSLVSILCVLFLAVQISAQVSTPSDSGRLAGFRASRILQSYPGNQFPSSAYWSAAGKWVAGKFTNAHPAGVWIVSLYISNGTTQMNFPSGGLSLPYVNFISVDHNEAYLQHLDQEGYKIWLQVEPGAASVDTLISIVLNRYKHHPCVAGFGVDVEWLDTHLHSGGRKVTDAEAQRWEAKVKAVNPGYTLFLKHYGQSWMPPAYRGDIMFIDDSQMFTSLNQLVNEFKSWGNKFAPNKVGFQIGYPKDSVWWNKLSDPVRDIGTPLFQNIPNCAFVAWVDFTLTRVFPLTTVQDQGRDVNQSSLLRIYPNPANASAEILWNTPIKQEGVVQITDIVGRVVQEDRIENQKGYSLDLSGISSGTYLVRVLAPGYQAIQKLIVLK